MPRIGIRDLKTHASNVLRDVCDNRALRGDTPG